MLPGHWRKDPKAFKNTSEMDWIQSHEQAILNRASGAATGSMIAISVEDPFGALTKEVIISYLERCYYGSAGIMNANKGGAGRGLHQIIEKSDLTIFNVKKGIKTEVISIFNLETSRKDHKLYFHYFFT